MHVLLSGASGLVGQYLLRDLLLEGQPVAVVIRSQGKKSAEQRLEQILDYWERDTNKSLPRPKCLEGDIGQEDLGLSKEDRAWVADHCRSIIHNAASLTFFGKDRDQEPWLSNYTGTAHVLDFCRRARVREMHYMSTAYVCGRRTGVIRENEFECGQEFRNDYEECKFEAEKLVRAANFFDQLTVYRPAVIVGDSHTGYTATYHGLYSYLQFVWLMVRMLPHDDDDRIYYPCRLTLTGEERRNLIPVDWVSAVTSHIFLNPSLHGQTYHLTPLEQVTARESHDAMMRYFNFYGPTFVGPGELDPASMNDYEKMFYEYVSRYMEYWSVEPVFDCSHTLAAAPDLPCPTIDAACWQRLIDYAVQDRFGKRRDKRPELAGVS
jgi:thioester reductase-like protein